MYNSINIHMFRSNSFFGGTWCPNTQAIAMLANDLAKDYGISKIYMFDPRLDNGTKIDAASKTEVDGAETNVIVENSAYLASNLNTRNSDIAALTIASAKGILDDVKVTYAESATIDQLAQLILDNKTKVAAYEENGKKPYEAYGAFTSLDQVKEKLDGGRYNYAHVYAKFLNEYLPEYESEWNYNVEFTIGGKQYTKMCVPNMMMFNGEDEGKAELVGLAEAEYTYANTSVEGNPQNVEWTNAIKAIFDQNPYAYYAPLPDAVEETEEEAGGESAAAPSAPAADAGGC